MEKLFGLKQSGLCACDMNEFRSESETILYANDINTMYTFDEGGTSAFDHYLIKPQAVRRAIMHQDEVEQSLQRDPKDEKFTWNENSVNLGNDRNCNIHRGFSKNEGEDGTEYSSMNKDSSSSSIASSNAETVSSTDSGDSSVFSVLTAIISNTNKYGIPKSPSPIHRLTKSFSPTSVMNERYSIREESEDCEDDDDWDFNMNVNTVDTSTDSPMRRDKKSYCLHLKIPCNMGLFYRETFLLHFPQYALPKALNDTTMHLQGRSQTYEIDTNDTCLSPPHISRSTTLLDTTPAVRLAVDGSSFQNLFFSGSLGLVESKPHHSSLLSLHGNHIKLANSGRRDFFILCDGSMGIPLLVCSLKSKKGRPIVRIYSTKQRAQDQIPSATTSDIGLNVDMPLYAWAELKAKGEFPDSNAKYHLHMCTGLGQNQFSKVPLYSVEMDSPTEFNIFGRKEDKHLKPTGTLFHCARTCVRRDTKSNDYNYMISIVKGIEVANILAIIGVIDELIEFKMRKKCAINSWKFAQNDVDNMIRIGSTTKM